VEEGGIESKKKGRRERHRKEGVRGGGRKTKK
jgi:hypothetical protein